LLARALSAPQAVDLAIRGVQDLRLFVGVGGIDEKEQKIESAGHDALADAEPKGAWKFFRLRRQPQSEVP